MQAEEKTKQLIGQAAEKQATDIHLIPASHGYTVKYRAAGHLLTSESMPVKEGERLIAYLKFTASMDIGEKRKPQSGSFHTDSNGIPLSLRISTLPAVPHKESLVIRLLPQQRVPPLHELTLLPSASQQLISLLSASSGLIVLSGPTGSGKSTTLYSMIQHCATHLNKHVITLEDPVEKQQDAFVQIQVNEKAGITYATGLKAILRHDPDVIMVGEIRDEETARAAVKSALTGHLVLTTVHARHAAGVITRLEELGVTRDELTQTVIGITAQRLVALLLTGTPTAPQALVCDILTGEPLRVTLEQTSGPHSGNGLEKQLTKGVAYGFIDQKEWARWSDGTAYVREAKR